MTPRVEIVGDVEKAAPYIQWAQHQWALREGYWVQHTDDYLIEFSRSGSFGKIRIIAEDFTGFFLHPRTSDVIESAEVSSGVMAPALRGGWKDGITKKMDGKEAEQMDQKEVFPLFDADNATYLISDSDNGFVGIDGGAYGNITWANSDFSEVISYKGTPTRHFPLEKAADVGMDYVNASFYGQHGYLLYRQGSILTNGPKQNGILLGIKGASVVNGVAYLVADNDLLYSADLASVDANNNAAWAQVTNVDGSLTSLPSSHQWFFAKDGLSAVSSRGDRIIIDPKKTKYSLFPYTFASGVRTINSTDSMSYTDVGESFFELVTTTPIKATYTASASFSTTVGSTNNITYSGVGNYLKNPPTDVFWQETAGFVYVATYGRSDGLPMSIPDECGPVTIIMSGAGVIDLGGGRAQLSSRCYPSDTTVVITATVTGPGFTLSGNYSVFIAASTGYWSLVSDTFYRTLQCPYLYGKLDCKVGCTPQTYGVDFSSSQTTTTIAGNIKTESTSAKQLIGVSLGDATFCVQFQYYNQNMFGAFTTLALKNPTFIGSYVGSYNIGTADLYKGVYRESTYVWVCA